jgi:hypothetical protein
MSGSMAFVALAFTTALGILSAASALAGSDRDSDRGRQLCVVPCSLDGVNPVYHPVFLAIRPSRKTVTASSKGRTILGT